MLSLEGVVYIDKRGLNPSHQFRKELANAQLGDRACLLGCHSGRPALAFCYHLGRGRGHVFGDSLLPCGTRAWLRQSQAPSLHFTDGEAQKPSLVSTGGVCAAQKIRNHLRSLLTAS